MIPVILNIILVKSPGQGTATSQLKLDQLASQVYTRVTKYQLPYIHSQTSQLYFKFYLASYIYSQRIIYSCIYPIQLLGTTNQYRKPSMFLLAVFALSHASMHYYPNIQQQFMFCQSSNLSIFNFLLYTSSPPPCELHCTRMLDSIKPLEHSLVSLASYTPCFACGAYITQPSQVPLSVVSSAVSGACRYLPAVQHQ